MNFSDKAKLLEKINADNTDHVSMFKLGCYYSDMDRDYSLAKQYFSQAIELGNIDAIKAMGNHYTIREINYPKAKEYFLMGTELGDCDSMCSLGRHYKNFEIDDIQMKKYYLMAFELKDYQAALNLGVYHRDIEKNYEKSMYYFFKCLEFSPKQEQNTLISIEEVIMRMDKNERYKYLIQLNLSREEVNSYLDECFNIEFASKNFTKLSRMNKFKLNFQDKITVRKCKVCEDVYKTIEMDDSNYCIYCLGHLF